MRRGVADENSAKSVVEQLKAKAPVVEVVDRRVIRKGRLPVPRRGNVPDTSINHDATGPAVFDQRRFEMRQINDPLGAAAAWGFTRVRGPRTAWAG